MMIEMKITVNTIVNYLQKSTIKQKLSIQRFTKTDNKFD